MFIYHVIGWKPEDCFASFNKDYKRRCNADKQFNKLKEAGYIHATLREEDILVDRGEECYISIDKPVLSF